MLIDTHAHLFDYSDADLKKICGRAKENQVEKIINTSVNLESSRRVLDQLHTDQSLSAAVGISPFDVEGCTDRTFIAFEQLASEKGVLALGEIGLDDSNPRYPALSKQEYVFCSLLEIAAEKSLPVIVHSRGAERKVFDYCRKYDISRVLFHCYTGPLDVLADIVEAGFHVSFSGIVTYSSDPLKDHVQMVPLDQLSIESDSPYLAPVPHRGKTNEPAYVRYTASAICAKRDITLTTLEERLSMNFNMFFHTK